MTKRLAALALWQPWKHDPEACLPTGQPWQATGRPWGTTMPTSAAARSGTNPANRANPDHTRACSRQLTQRHGGCLRPGAPPLQFQPLPFFFGGSSFPCSCPANDRKHAGSGGDFTAR